MSDSQRVTIFDTTLRDGEQSPGATMGLVLLEIGDDVAKINDGDKLSVDADTGVIKNLTTGATIQCKPVPPFMSRLLL